MESGSLSNWSALKKLSSTFSFWTSRSNRTPQDHAETSSLAVQTTQDHAETSRSTARDYEKWKTELMNNPGIRSIFDIMEFDMLLQRIKENIGMLNIESDQNQLIEQLVELIKMNVNLLIHEPDLLQSIISQLRLEDLDVLLAASHTTDEASTCTQHDDPVKKIKKIYELLENAKARAGDLEFNKNLIEAIRNLIQQYDKEFQGEHQFAPAGSNIDPNKLNNDVAEHIVNLLPVELRPALAKSNLFLVKGNLEQMNRILILLKQKSFESNGNQIALKDKLINVTSNLINQISRVDCRLSNPQAESNWEEIMKSHASRIIQLMCSPKAKLYIHESDSFKDICNQVAAMYKHSHYQKKKGERRIDANYTWCGSFHNDILNGNCKAAEKFLKENPLALTAKIRVDGNTALHVAVQGMQLKMVRMLLEKLTAESRLIEALKKRNEESETAFYTAALSGFRVIAQELVKYNKDILLTKHSSEISLPLFVAAVYNHKDMVIYLYEKMQEYKNEMERTGNYQQVEYWFPIREENKEHPKARLRTREWTVFLANLIYNEDYDMALRVIEDYPNLGLYRYTDTDTPLSALAKSRYFGANVIVHSKASILQYFNTFLRGNKIVDDGTVSIKASQLLKQIILTISDLQSKKPAVSVAFFKAAEVGNYEFIAMFIKAIPPMVYWLNDEHQTIFHVAIINRQENVFNLIHGLAGSIRNGLTRSVDKFNNCMLHLAGKIAPPHRLNQVQGPALQLQRELQWFKAVEEIVPKIYMSSTNLKNKMTPYELFASTHQDLMKDAKDWMRNTASSCSIVATLNATVVFAAAFTVPGGNNQNTGDPMFLGDLPFLLFVGSDLVALSTSCTSVLIFLSILTSGFAQEVDFLISLPRKLMWGLVFLFVSMTAMMFAFCDTIYIITRDHYEYWFYIPVISVGFIPVLTFWLLMFPLSMNLWQTTYIRAPDVSIFDSSSGRLY